MESQSFDNEFYIIYDSFNPDMYAIEHWNLPAEHVSNQRENLNGMDQGPSQTVSAVSSGSEDDSIQVLKVIRPQCLTRSQLAGNVADPNRRVRLRRRRIRCALCDQTLRMLRALNRNMGAAVCGHLICNRCMEFMFRNNWKICGICRIRLNEEDYHPVFF